MPRCSCAGTSCNCAVQGSGAAVVNGSGTADDPYIVGIQPQAQTFSVTGSSNTLNLSTYTDAVTSITITLGANLTITAMPSQPGQIDILFVQDGTGSRTVTWPGSGAVLWPGGTAPAVTTAANSKDWFHLVGMGATTQWVGARLGANLS